MIECLFFKNICKCRAIGLLNLKKRNALEHFLLKGVSHYKKMQIR